MSNLGSSIKNVERLVIKVGTSTLTHKTGNVNIRRFELFVKVLADIKNSGKEVILVSSGAMAIGRGKLGIITKPKDMPTNQATAAIGQGELMHLYDTNFANYSHIVAQILLNKDDIEVEKRKNHITDTFNRLLELDCIPIVNENDTVSVEEIEIGDNDNLSAIVADICKADRLIILTDIDGLYDSDPRTNPEAKLIRQVNQIDAKLCGGASGVGSERGTGGMLTKLHAAKRVMEKGIHVHIINGDDPCDLYKLLDGQQIGTYFKPSQV